MRGAAVFLCCLTLAGAANSQVLQPGAGNCNYPYSSLRTNNLIVNAPNALQNIYKLIDNGETYISRAEGRDVILLLGNTGSGKSTLGQLLTVDNKNLRAVKQGSGEYTIIDTTGKIGKLNTYSHTIFPELMEGNETFIDCPGFKDTRDASFDIAASYLIKAVIDRAKRVKILFLVGHSSVRQGGVKDDFTTLLNHATTLVKDIDRFSQSIGLVVTKVDNTVEEQEDGSIQYASDEQIKRNVASYFEAVKVELATQSSDKTTSLKNRKYIRLIDIFLSKKDNEYYKFGIFRRPTKIGPLSKSIRIQYGKRSIEKLAYDSIIYASKISDHFGYTISDKSKQEVSNMVVGINMDISSNVEAIATEVKSHFRQIEKDFKNAFELHTMFTDASSNVSSALEKAQNSNDPWLLVHTLLHVAERINLRNVQNYLSNILKQKKLFKFLELVNHPQKLNAQQSDWIYKFNTNVKKYLTDSKIWYGFLISLYEKLSAYDIQSNTTKYNVSNLDYWGTGGKEQGIAITSRNLEKFLTKIDKLDILSLNDAKNLKVRDDLKLTVLNSILDVTLKRGIEYNFNDNTLVASGHFVRLDSVYDKLLTNYSSPNIMSNVKNLEIIASDTVFINSDLDLLAQEMNVSILAPRWYVHGTRVITLDGGDKTKQVIGKAVDSSVPGSDGKDGKAGVAGGAAGNFFGVGKIFTNGDQLTVTAIGGNGGPGQNGGNGANGIDGHDPILPSSVPLKENLTLTEDFKSDVTYISGYSEQYTGFQGIGTEHYYRYFNISGTKGTVGGQGGNGGSGGVGGAGGIVRIVALEDKSRVLSVTRNGFQGKGGSGGSGGAGGIHGCSLKVRYYAHRYFMSIDRNNLIVDSRDCNNKAGVGRNGTNATRKNTIDNQIGISVLNRYSSETLNKFKSLLRENLLSGGPKKTIYETYQLLNNSVDVLNVYDAFGFINEMQSMENHFYKLTSKIDFQPFYNSLLQRISNKTAHDVSIKNSPEKIKVMSYLYSAALSKVCSLKNGVGGSHVVDIRLYLETAVSNIKSWEKSTLQETIAKHNDLYQSDIDIKMSGANDFLDNQINGEIKKIDRNIEENVARLINETIGKQKHTEHNRQELMKNREDLKRALVIRRMFGVLKIAGSVAGFLGPWGKLVEGAVGTAGIITEHFVTDTNKTPVLKTLLDTAEKNVKEINERRNEILKHMLNVSSVAVKKDPKVLGGNGTAEKIKTILAKTEEANNDLNLENVEKLEVELKDVIDKREKELKENRNGADQRKTNDALAVIDKLNVLSKVTDTAFDLYKEYKNDDAKVAELTAAIDSEGKAIAKLRQFEAGVYKTMWPMITSVRNTINRLTSDLDGKSQVGLDVSQWQIQSTIRDMKLEIQKFTKGFDVQDDIVRCIEKLEEAMTILIKVYDRIQNYQDQKKLANFIKDVTSASANEINVKYPELKISIRKLEIMIRGNIILSQYETAISSFKQYAFPFAHQYLDDYELPSSLQVGNTADLVEKAVKNLNSLKLKLVNSDAVISNTEDSQMNKHDYCGYDRFYLWDETSNSKAISQLLSGEVVTLKADVKDNKVRNAVKFKVIGIRITAANASIQDELNVDLQGFSFNMTHLGNSYYKCGEKYFTISTDSVSIRYSVMHNRHEEPTTANEVYTKLKNGDLSLSPYAMWSVQLYGSDMSRLVKYKGQVEMELVGRGSFLDTGAKVCNTNLEKYYTLDENLSAISVESVV